VLEPEAPRKNFGENEHAKIDRKSDTGKSMSCSRIEPKGLMRVGQDQLDQRRWVGESRRLPTTRERDRKRKMHSGS